MRKTTMMLFPIFIIPFLLIGSGYAIYYFGSDRTDKNQDISIDITPDPTYGSLKLLYIDDDGQVYNEIQEKNFENQILMDLDQVHLIRGDNLTISREFILSYEEPQAIDMSLNLAIYCDIVIEDKDESGVVLHETIIDETSYIYPYSASITDYYAPNYVYFASESQNQKFIDVTGVKEKKKKVYSACVMENILNKTEEEIQEAFHIEFSYLDFSILQGDDVVEGNMAPMNSSHEEIVNLRMIEAKNAALNSEVSIAFRLYAKP